MAMNKREKKELEDAKAQAAAAVHLRWPEGQKPTPLTSEQIAALMVKTELKDKRDRPCVALFKVDDSHVQSCLTNGRMYSEFDWLGLMDRYFNWLPKVFERESDAWLWIRWEHCENAAANLQRCCEGQLKALEREQAENALRLAISTCDIAASPLDE